jgi:sec-independent protein translocase protein TatA
MPLLGIPSFWELVIIFAVVFLLFGGKKLPELGGAIGESIKNFKKGLKDDEPSKKIADNPNQTNSNDKEQPPQA